LGPASGGGGRQSYLDDRNVIVTSWQAGDGELELTDAMLSPNDSRPAGGEAKRVLMRRLRCKHGSVRCAMELTPRGDFAAGLVTLPVPGGLELRVAGCALGLWTTSGREG
jgi:hypothetical protein